MATGVTTTALIRRGDILAADGEHGLERGSAYSWLIDSGATHSMTPYRSNYVTFTRRSLSITVANGETTMAEGYGNVLVDLPISGSELEQFWLKDVWYVPELDCSLLSVPQLLTQGIATVFTSQEGALLKEHKTIISIDVTARRFWLRTTNEISVAYRRCLAVGNVATALSAKEKKPSAKTRHRDRTSKHYILLHSTLLAH
jgi:hypothetical protein